MFFGRQSKQRRSVSTCIYLPLPRQVDEEHPFARFDVGTSETLHGDSPQRTREELLRWNRQHYTADRMKVVIVTCQRNFW